MRLATVLGTRPEIIRLSRLIPKLDDAFEHVLQPLGAAAGGDDDFFQHQNFPLESLLLGGA